MTFRSIDCKDVSNLVSTNTLDHRRQQLKQWLHECRLGTLALFEGVDDATFCRQAHLDFSPVGWHLGHIAYTESLWLLERGAGILPLFPEYRRLFVADGLPKSKRVNLPKLAEVRHYLDTVREKVWRYLETADLDRQEPLWRWVIQHESQHSETIAFVLQIQGSRELRAPSRESEVVGAGFTDMLVSKQTGWLNPPVQESRVTSHESEVRSYLLPAPPASPASPAPPAPPASPARNSELGAPSMIEIPAGFFEQGNDSIDALDNECPVHRVYLETYWIDRYPVTCGQYKAFMDAGGYQNPSWWSAAGWEWLQSQLVTQPLHWSDISIPNRDSYTTAASTSDIIINSRRSDVFDSNENRYNLLWDNHPVCGVSWYEAEAYARFVGKRLPTEAEWEKAASWDVAARRRRTYPWGEAAPDAHQCNHNNYVDQTTPVEAYPGGQSAYGCYDMLGNVWEWTASVFHGYEGFVSYPYAGYSKVYFDGQHWIVKGGSWATRPWTLRCSFRNWYHPGVRQILAGFRCARSGDF